MHAGKSGAAQKGAGQRHAVTCGAAEKKRRQRYAGRYGAAQEDARHTGMLGVMVPAQEVECQRHAGRCVTATLTKGLCGFLR